MSHRTRGFYRNFPFLAIVLLLCLPQYTRAQGSTTERSFPQSKPVVEKVLKNLQTPIAGRLPVLEGFATSAEHPLDRYQRGYYQAKFQTASSPAGGSLVRVTVQVTAWYSDPIAARSAYKMLTSNGRLEADLLDQLAELLAGKASPVENPETGTLPERALKNPENHVQSSEPTLSAPMPRVPDSGRGFSSSLAQGLNEQERGLKTGQKKLAEKDRGGLQTEAESLEEIVKNQAHPKDLVAIKKSGTPVVGTPSLTAKTLFLASAHDEFEMLDFNRDWVHVKISGLSRGWIWRNGLEMPEGIPDSDLPAGTASAPVAADLFHVSREERALFPGDWAPLRGKTVKIISVEYTNEEKDLGPKLRLEFVKSLLDKSYDEMSRNSQELAGIVVIFDAADGGMIAASLPTIQQWKAGTLSDAALWHRCFFDPPESSNLFGSSASQ